LSYAPTSCFQHLAIIPECWWADFSSILHLSAPPLSTLRLQCTAWRSGNRMGRLQRLGTDQRSRRRRLALEFVSSQQQSPDSRECGCAIFGNPSFRRPQSFDPCRS